MLRAVDAARVELVHDLGLRRFGKSELAEELRRERQHQHFARIKPLDVRDDRLDEETSDSALAEHRLHRDGHDLHRRRLGVADLGMDLVRRAADHLPLRLGDHEPVDRLDDVAERPRHQHVAVERHEREYFLRISQCRRTNSCLFHWAILYQNPYFRVPLMRPCASR